jgi:HAE1 family hydrophobic/amphiphilic exporter-1
MLLVNASVKRPIAMTTVILVLVLFGVLAYPRLGLDLMPPVEVPYVTVVAVYPGASPDEMETAVARKLEDAVVSIDGLKHIYTSCMENVCQILLEFELDREVDQAATDVREKIGLVRADLPDAAEEPQVLKYDINARPVVSLALTGDRPLEDLYDYADNSLRDRLSTLAGVASVELTGGAKREVHVIADRAKMAARGLTVLHLVEAVRNGHAKVPAGAVRQDGRETAVTFDADAEVAADLGDLEVGTAPGGPRV